MAASPGGPLTGVAVANLSGPAGPAQWCAGILAGLGASPVGSAGGTASCRPPDIIVTDGDLPAAVGPGQSAVVVSRDGPAPDALETVALAAAHAAVVALAGLRHARRHRVGVRATVSTLDVLAHCLGDDLPRAICGGGPPAAGRRPDLLDVVRCTDGYISVALRSEEDRQNLQHLAGAAGAGNASGLLAGWARTRGRDEAVAELQLWRIPATPVRDPAELAGGRDSRAAAGAPVPGGGPFRLRAGGAPAGPEPHRVVRTSGRTRQCPAGGVPGLTAPATMPLSGVRVLDLGMVWAGPYCARLLAGLGAQVTKLEGPRRPDGTRPDPGAGCGGAFVDLHQGKRSVVLDLSAPEGREALLRMAAHADVLVENFSPRVMPNFDLGYGRLSAENPGLVMVSMPAFDSEGAWSSFVAYGPGLELAAGLGRALPQRPAPTPVAYLDYLAGAYGAVAVLAALHGRAGNGVGTHIEVAQYDVARTLVPALRHRSRTSYAGLADRLVAGQALAGRGLIAGPCRASRSHYTRPPWRFDGMAAPAPGTVAGFGADTVRTLRALGFGAADCDDLRRRGVAG